VSRIDSLRAWLETHPGERFAMYALALEHEKAGDLGSAESAYRALLRVHPTSGAGRLRLGLVLVAQGRPEDAREAWREGLAALAGATDAEARRSVGEIQRALDDLD
jgi:tetratricopeptide (TPR) repeat protein